MEVAFGMVVMSILLAVVMFAGSLFVLSLYPVVAFSASFLLFAVFAWSYFSSKDRKKWVRRHFSLFTAFCGLFVLYFFFFFFFAYFCF